MLKINDLTNTLSTTWDSVSQGWHHLISNASNALTHFGSVDNKEDVGLALSASPSWGLISADLFDDVEKVVVKLEAPGLANEDFDINIIDNILTISGEKRFHHEESKGEYRILECAYGRFTRSIPLEYEVDAESAKASYDKGVLKIQLDKKPHQRRRQIKVN